jgi:transcriptional regulator with XRE-family HTH domain
MKESKTIAHQGLSLRLVFARNVRLIRTHAGMSQESMADTAQLDRAFVGTLERGQRNISIDNIERIANAINVSPGELMNPDLAQIRQLDVNLIRAPRTTRLYPVERKLRSKK